MPLIPFDDSVKKKDQHKRLRKNISNTMFAYICIYTNYARSYIMVRNLYMPVTEYVKLHVQSKNAMASSVFQLG